MVKNALPQRNLEVFSPIWLGLKVKKREKVIFYGALYLALHIAVDYIVMVMHFTEHNLTIPNVNSSSWT